MRGSPLLEQRGQAARAGLLAVAGLLVVGFALPANAAALGELTQKPNQTGCLAPNNPTAQLICNTSPVGLQGATSLAVSPDGTSAYVTANSAGFGALGTCDRAPDGTLTQKSISGPCPCPGIIYDVVLSKGRAERDQLAIREW